jgi:cellulose synthase/poly-beta-1,6-N-acetylglucosamine synthase-like glycosyltransferase
LTTALAVVVLLLVLWGCVQFLFVLLVGQDQTRRHARGDRAEDEIEGTPEAVFFLIACLDEEAVIGETVRSALEAPEAFVVVVDDGSDDRTGQVAQAAGGDRVLVCRRDLPEARQGKGAALNVGYRLLLREVWLRRLPPEKVVVGVMDADGRLSPGAVEQVSQGFADRRVGGLQLPVRIRNRTNLLTRLQDFEFWGVSALAQLARMRTGSVSLGGNGQFTRLSALLGLARDPWSASLTEDLDLTVSLLVDGWRTTSAPQAFVSQQGVERLDRLVRQRTRWFQGHIGCIRRIPDLWRSNRLPNRALVEVTAYLLSPLALILPWSLLFTWSLFEIARAVAVGSRGSTLANGTLSGRLGLFLAWYLVSFAPNFAGALVYRARAKVSLVQSLGLAHLLIAFNYVTFFSTWKAVGRSLLGRRSWAKTVRSTEVAPRGARAEPLGGVPALMGMAEVPDAA